MINQRLALEGNNLLGRKGVMAWRDSWKGEQEYLRLFSINCFDQLLKRAAMMLEVAR